MNKEIIELLEKYEWDETNFCPICLKHKKADRKHNDDCWLDQALTKLREVPEQPPAGDFTKRIKDTYYVASKIVPLDLQEACDIIDQLQTENQELQYDKNAITKIWKILGIKTYEQAQGKSVDELVAELQARLDTSEAARKDLLAACKAQEEADNWFGASDTGRKLKDKAKELREAAIAKEKEG